MPVTRSTSSLSRLQILCYNICVAIQSQCELGIELVFWEDQRQDRPDVLPIVRPGKKGQGVAEWHLRELRDTLSRRGWRVLTEHPGDDYRVSGSWEIQRSTRAPPLIIDFDGLDDMACLPMQECYGCEVRGHQTSSVYFGKARGRRWLADLEAFVQSLDSLG